jgi:hypothetical protein
MENINPKSEIENPLSDLISDEIFQILSSRGLINERSVRNYHIRRRYQTFRSRNMSVSECIDLLRREYPYLQYDTIRKIIYRA